MHGTLTDAVFHLADVIREASNQHQTKAILERLAEMERRIMKTQAELTADLKLVLEQQKKTQAEIAALQGASDALKQKVIDLEAVIAGLGDASQELVDAVAAVKAQAQVVDDQIPDPVTPPPPPV